MIQIPANSNDATTGHKLQGMSKDVIIVSDKIRKFEKDMLEKCQQAISKTFSN